MTRPLNLCALAAFAMLSIACHPPEAGVELEVTLDSALAIDQLSIVMKSATVTADPVLIPEDAEALPEQTSVGLLVREAGLIDTDVTITVEGISDGTAFARGEASVAVQNRRVVEASVALAALFACGDGRIDPREVCDDGDANAGDGCDAACAIEPGYACAGAPSVCTRCGDGIVDRAAEECDDGDGVDSDGCSSACVVEDGYECSGAPSACVVICGDGLIVGGEQCDDGGIVGGDGCSDACAIEGGYACSGAPSACDPVCGDGVTIAPEACDDANATAGDGCSDACRLEDGFACNGAPSVCNTVCGDQIVAGAEECDDGAQNSDVSADACRADCTLPRCGDEVTDSGEECDDGNVDNGDACLTGCFLPSCGDGFINGDDACDDANDTGLDGCTDCAVEALRACAGAPSVCELLTAFRVVDAGGGGDFATIAEAIAAANDGDVIAIEPATYAGSLTVNKDVTLVGNGPNVVIQGGAGNAAIVISQANVTIQGVTVRSTSNGQSAIRVDNNASLTVLGSTLGPTTKHGLETANGSTVIVRRTLVTENVAGGLLLDGSWTVESSAIVENGSAASELGGVRLRVGGTFRFNTVVGNLASAEGGVRCQQATTIASSIIFGNGGPQQVSQSCNIATSSTEDPLLDVDGIHLSEGSPAIDAAAQGCPTFDLDGDRRPIGEACDLGADERP